MLQFDQNRCIGCGRCTDVCFFGSIVLEEGKPVLRGECMQCGHCFALCPQKAIAVTGYPHDDVAEASDGSVIDAEQLLHTLKLRRSIRDYRQQPVEQDKLERILQAARYTATGANSQEFRFVVVQDRMEEFRARLWQGMEQRITAYGERVPQDQFYLAGALKRYLKEGCDRILWNAPCAVFIASNHRWSWDAGMASQNMELMAVAQGLGALYNGYLLHAVESDAALKQWLGIPDVPVKTAMLLGYPAPQYLRSAPRKPANVIWR